MVASLKKVPHLNDGPTRMYKEEERMMMRVNYLNLSQRNLEHLYIHIFAFQ